MHIYMYIYICIYIYIYAYIYMYIYMYIYISTIHRHMFCPSQELSVWLRLTSREQLMSPECSSSELSSIENFFSNLKLIT